MPGKADSSAVVIGSKEIVPIPFRLLAKPRITRRWGHPHSPFGYGGEDSYTYKGDVAFSNTRARLETYRQPIAMVRHQDAYYVMACSYFDKVGVDFYRYSDPGNFKKVRYDRLPEVFRDLRFVDKDVQAVYRIDWVNHFGRKDPNRALPLFKHYTKLDRRFCFIPGWKQLRCGVGTSLLWQRVVPKKAVGFYDPVTVLVQNSVATDDPQELTSMCVTLVYLKPKEAREFLLRVKDTFQKEKVPGDTSARPGRLRLATAGRRACPSFRRAVTRSTLSWSICRAWPDFWFVR